MKLDNSFEFGIVEIRDLGFNVDENLDADHPEDWITSMDVTFNKESNWVQVVVRVDFRDETGNTLAKGSVLTRFFIPNLTQYFSSDQEYVLSLPSDYDLTLFSLSFTHTRAILAKNLSGSKYSRVIVPLVNPQEFFLQFRAKKEHDQRQIKKAKPKRTSKEPIRSK